MDYYGFERFVEKAGLEGVLPYHAVKKIFDEQLEIVNIEKEGQPQEESKSKELSP